MRIKLRGKEYQKTATFSKFLNEKIVKECLNARGVIGGCLKPELLHPYRRLVEFPYSTALSESPWERKNWESLGKAGWE